MSKIVFVFPDESELVCLGKLWHHNLRTEFEVLQFYK